MNITLDDGRTELWQWDTGRKIVVDDKSVSEVHYSKYSSIQAITREVIDGKAEIPNFLLQDTHEVTAYAYSGSIENGYTMAEKTFNVVKKPKPANYVETEEDKAILAKLKEEIGDLSALKTDAKDNLVEAINEAAKSASWNELKDKPFYLEKTLVVELTKDDFTVNDQDGHIKYVYRSTPKLDWFVSAESIAFEIEIIDTNGRRYMATQDSIDISFEKEPTDDGYEYSCCYSSLFDIVSGVDLDLYNNEYYYKDEWGVLVDYDGLEFSEINIKIHRVDVKKIPEICLDAAIGKTAITVGSVELDDSETEMSPSAIVPDLRIPISPSDVGEAIYYNRIFGQLRVSGNLFPYKGKVDYKFPHATPTTAGSSISFDISSELDTLWGTVGVHSPWYYGSYLFFDLMSIYSGGGRIRFLSRGPSPSFFTSAVASSNLGHLYTVVFEYTNNYKTLNVTIKCVA